MMLNVFCVGMYRACSTWQYEVASHLVETRLGGKRLGFRDADDFSIIRASNRPENPVGILKAHDYHPIYARAVAAGEAVAIYAYRDIRDVAYSYMHKASISFDEMVSIRFIPKVLYNDRNWRAQPGILVQRYDEILGGQAESIAELSTHLGISLPDAEVARLVEEYSWDSNYKRTQSVRREAEAAGLDLEDRANTNKQDPVTLLHWNHLRPSEGKGWQSLSTTSQRETLAFLCGEWLIENGYETNMNWITDYNKAPMVIDEPKPCRVPGPLAKRTSARRALIAANAGSPASTRRDDSDDSRVVDSEG